jgi:hypothetical protein
MTPQKIRREIESYWQKVEVEGDEMKNPMSAVWKMTEFYRSFDAKKRFLADQFVSDWVLSDDEGARYMALSLIEDFRIQVALPNLRKLANRLSLSKEPGAPFEIEKINRIFDTFPAQTQK